MHQPQINLKRTGLVLSPDRSRVLVRPFAPASEERCRKIVARVLALSESEVQGLLAGVLAEFEERHLKVRELFLERCECISQLLKLDQPVTEARRLLLGSYFTCEYALESAALFNPSIVPHYDQTDLPADSLRFILSLRATGEGHISSVTFRTGVLDAASRITLNTPTRHVTEPRKIPNAAYHKALFLRTLGEMGLVNDLVHRIVGPLGDRFTLAELTARVEAETKERPQTRDVETDRTARSILLLARSNYEAEFTADQRLSERVIFPSSPSQSNGIEDARFVLFQDDDGTRTYYATYTAFDGKLIFPQLLETTNFLHFKVSTLNGPAVQNKGMALFPRKINGQYAMLSRQDNENIFLMYSDNINFWYKPQLLLEPSHPWEFIQLGNCGSPIETEAGWLVLSHGVGAMRKYCIGAFLLDRTDPAKVIGRLRAPLLQPTTDEREGYVPNVVYSCGLLLHRGELIIPYAMADYATGFATVPLDEVLAAME